MNDTQLKIRGCLLCIGNGLDNETFTNPNKTIGQINHYIFPLLGNGSASIENKTIFLKENILTDLKEFTGKKISYRIEKEAKWVAFNSLLERDIKVKILTKTPPPYKNNSHETIFVALEGTASVNDKKLSTFKSGRLFKGKQATIVLEPNSILAAITFNNL